MAVAIAASRRALNTPGIFAVCGPSSSRRRRWREALGKFWFDVTKADWRETLVMSVSETGPETSAGDVLVRSAPAVRRAGRRAGRTRILLCRCGAGRSRGMLLLLLYAANLAFAWTYNVGDAYIFFLPSHYVVALCAGAGVAAIAALCARVSSRTVAIAAGALLSGLSRVARLRHVSRRRSQLGQSRRQLLDEFTDATSARAQTRFRRRRELAGAERVRVLHARAQTRASPGSPPKSSSGCDGRAIAMPVRGISSARMRKPGATWSSPSVLQRRSMDRHTVAAAHDVDAAVPAISATQVKSVRTGTPYVARDSAIRSGISARTRSVSVCAWPWLAPRTAGPDTARSTRSSSAGSASGRVDRIAGPSVPRASQRSSRWTSTSGWNRGCRPTPSAAPASVTSSSTGSTFSPWNAASASLRLAPESRPIYGSGLFAAHSAALVHPQSLIPNP